MRILKLFTVWILMILMSLFAPVMWLLKYDIKFEAERRYNK